MGGWREKKDKKERVGHNIKEKVAFIIQNERVVLNTYAVYILLSYTVVSSVQCTIASLSLHSFAVYAFLQY